MEGDKDLFPSASPEELRERNRQRAIKILNELLEILAGTLTPDEVKKDVRDKIRDLKKAINGFIAADYYFKK
jgi:hypothetical protein